MRKDFNKILCETYKETYMQKQGKKYHGARTKMNRLFEDVGGPAPVKKSHYQTKSFGENLSPLYRFVESQVNRPWDKVYSDICKTFDKRSVVNNHILQHIYDVVAKPERTKFENGKVVYYDGLAVRGLEMFRQQFYVDPRDGILKRNKLWKSYAKRQKESVARRKTGISANKVVIDKDTELFRIKGHWFVATIKDMPPPIEVIVPPKFNTLEEQFAWYKTNRTRAAKLSAGAVLKFRMSVNSVDVPFGDIGPLTEEYAYLRQSPELNWATKGVLGRTSSFSSKSYTRYYATLKSANHALLKKHGLAK